MRLIKIHLPLAQLIQKDVEPRGRGGGSFPPSEIEGRGQVPQGSSRTQSRSAGHMTGPS